MKAGESLMVKKDLSKMGSFPFHMNRPQYNYSHIHHRYRFHMHWLYLSQAPLSTGLYGYYLIMQAFTY